VSSGTVSTAGCNQALSQTRIAVDEPTRLADGLRTTVARFTF